LLDQSLSATVFGALLVAGKPPNVLISDYQQSRSFGHGFGDLTPNRSRDRRCFTARYGKRTGKNQGLSVQWTIRVRFRHGLRVKMNWLFYSIKPITNT